MARDGIKGFLKVVLNELKIYIYFLLGLAGIGLAIVFFIVGVEQSNKGVRTLAWIILGASLLWVAYLKWQYPLRSQRRHSGHRQGNTHQTITVKHQRPPKEYNPYRKDGSLKTGLGEGNLAGSIKEINKRW